MKLYIVPALLIHTCFLAHLSAGMDQKSPFSSPEEKRFILTVAGRDGQIDQEEWARSRTDREHFKNLDWDVLVNFDIDGDGLVGVNEFYRYIERRMADASPESGEDAVRDPARTALAASASGSQVIQAPPMGFDRRILYRRSQIAQRTKIQRRADPRVLIELEQERRQHLKTMTDRRRTAARNQAMLATVDPSTIRDIYKAKLVKNRLTRPSTGAGSLRNALFEERRRRADQSAEIERRRAALRDQQRTVAPVNQARERLESLRRPGGSAESRDTRSYREASDIRSLIPPAPSRDRTTSPKKEPERNPKSTNEPRTQGNTRGGGKR